MLTVVILGQVLWKQSSPGGDRNGTFSRSKIKLRHFYIGVNQNSANWGPDLRFVLEANIKALISKSTSGQVIKLMDRGRVT